MTHQQREYRPSGTEAIGRIIGSALGPLIIKLVIFCLIMGVIDLIICIIVMLYEFIKKVIQILTQLVVIILLLTRLSDTISAGTNEICLSASANFSQFLVGIIIIFVVGNVAGYLTPDSRPQGMHVNLALSTILLGILQVKNLIIPLLTVLGGITGLPHFALIFNPVELLIFGVSALTAAKMLEDNKAAKVEAKIICIQYFVSAAVVYFIN